MAEISFSLADLFERAFGYKTRAFEPVFKPVASINPPGRTEQGTHGSPYYGKDRIGTEYYMPVTLTYADVTPLPPPPEGISFSEGDSSIAVLKKWNLPYPV